MEDQWRPYVPYTRWAPPRVYVTTSFFIPCLGKQSEPKLQARVRRSKNLTSALQKLRIGSVLNVLGLGSPLGGCGPLKKRIWSGHILAKALSNFSDCQAPLNRQQNPTNMAFQRWLVGGIPTPLKNMKVSWDDYSQLNGKNKIHVPNHQPDWYCT